MKTFKVRIIKLVVIFVFLGCSDKSEIFKDLDFENKCSISGNGCLWQKSWGRDDCCKIITIEENSFLKISGKEEVSVSFIEQEAIVPKQNAIRILSISSMVKSIEVKGKGAGLNIGIYDENDALIANKDMGGFYSLDWITGNSDWQKIKISIIAPVNSHKIKIGAILYGKGEAQFDDFNIQFINIGAKKNIANNPTIHEAIELVKNNSLVRDSIDFKKLKTKVAQIAEASDNNLALEYLLESLREYGDHHSFIMKADEAKNWKENDNSESTIDLPSIKIKENVGIINVPPFHSGNEKLMVAYADSLQQGLKNIYSKDLKGWIVDLRHNTGGNMEPMIVGLGPLLDSGKIGSLVDIHKKHEHWYYKNGQYYWENEKGISLSRPFNPDRKLPIVVLTSDQTGSSGEVVVISFIGNTNTVLMGKPTWGLTTGNGEFKLESGTKLFMASTKMVDRNGVIYSAQINPDYLIEDDEKIIPSAIEWINNHQ